MHVRQFAFSKTGVVRLNSGGPPYFFGDETWDDIGGIPACVIFVDLEPGQGPSLHKHPYAEIFIVLEGESMFDDGSQTRVAQAGEVVIAPASTATTHS